MPGRRTKQLAVMCALAIGLGGCQVVGFFAGAYDANTPKTVSAMYMGLEGKSFAVVIATDRGTQGDFPGLVDYLEAQITARMSKNDNQPAAGGFVPATDVLKFTYDNPGWPARTRESLAKSLGGVQRVVVVELTEYRLHDPGNAYTWDGLASAQVSVFEADGDSPESPAFQKTVSVKFPDDQGYGPEQLPQAGVNTALAQRLVDRVAWLFTKHEEPPNIKY